MTFVPPGFFATQHNVAKFKPLWILSHRQAHAVKGKAPDAAGWSNLRRFGAQGRVRLDLWRKLATIPARTGPERTLTILSIPDMSCGHCKAAVETALASVLGDHAVAVDLATRQVTISGDAPVPSLLAALATAGYPAALVG